MPTPISMRHVLLVSGALFSLTPAQAAAPGQARVVEDYADLADLTLGSPVVLQATINKAKRLDKDVAPDVPAGQVRMLIEADVQNVLVARDRVPARIRYLWQGPLDARGKPPKLKGAPVMLFLRPAANRVDQYQLRHPQGQIAWSPNVDSEIRRILTEARAPELQNLRLTGIGNAFHVRGSIPGESESQIFLTTASGRPVSLVVLARPGQAKSFSVALTEVIDDAAQVIKPRTLLWYHLACQLPAELPADSIDSLDEADRTAVREDYRFVRESLGPCTRTLG